MPNVFQMSGASTGQNVSGNLPSLTAAPVDLYFGCWVNFTGSTAICVGSLTETLSYDSQSATLGFYDFSINENGQLSVYCRVGNQSYTSSDTTPLNDGNWHHVGFYVYCGLSNAELPLNMRGVLFFKDGSQTDDASNYAVISSVATAPAGSIATSYGFRLGSNSPDGQGPMNGCIGNVLMQTGLMNLEAISNTVPPVSVPMTDVANFVSSTYAGIPSADAGTLLLVELLPGELTRGAKAYTNLANSTALSIDAGAQVTYMTQTYLDGLSEMALYAPSTPFPGADGGSDGLSQAMMWIVQNNTALQGLFTYKGTPTIADLRAAYLDQSFNYASAQTDLYNPKYTPVNPATFTMQDFADAQAQFSAEFQAVGSSLNYYGDALNFARSLKSNHSQAASDLLPYLAVNEQNGSASGNVNEVITILCSLLELAARRRTKKDGHHLRQSAGSNAAAVIEGLFAFVNLFGNNPADAISDPFGNFAGPFSGLADQVATAWQNVINQLTDNIGAVNANWGALQLVPNYVQSGQLVWPVAFNNIPDGFEQAAQLVYMRTLLPSVYQGVQLVQGFNSISISDDVPAQDYTALGPNPNGNNQMNCAIGQIQLGFSGWELQDYPSGTAVQFLFGTTDDQLNCNAAEFWFQWEWQWTQYPPNADSLAA